MQPLEFLAAVLPSSGVYCVAEFNTKKKEHIFVSSIADMEPAINKLLGANLDVYFALANFKEAGNRVATNAKSVKSLFVDIDIGPEKDYKTRQEAASAFEKFMTETGMAELGQPFVVSSGGGFHIYWPFDEEVSITQWKPVAENFKRLCKQEGLNIDWNCTADAARVLRVPGTKNFKKDAPRNVKILVANSQPFTLFAIDGFIRRKLKTQTYEETLSTVAQLPGTRPKAAATATAVKLFENSETHFKIIVNKTKQGTGCGQLAHYIENAADDGMEPLWRGMLSLAQKCDDGGKAVVWLSKLHPYEPDRMAQKLREIKGPYPCLKLDSENPGICPSCPHFGKITNPLALGRKVATSTDAVEIPIQPAQAVLNASVSTPAPSTSITAPPPPRGFSYGKKGGVFRDAKSEDADGNEITKPIMVLPYNLFVVDILKHEDEHTVHMLAARPEGIVEVNIPQRAVVSNVETVKALAQQNVIASYGQGNDKHLFDYVRGCVEEASMARRAVKVPTNYGWQPDGTFVFNERVYSKNAVPRQVPMRGLINLNQNCQPVGSLDNWRKIIQLLVAKEYNGVLAMSLVGFGSVLMRYTGFAGITFHCGSSQSGVGKSLALELAGSVWGHPVRYRVGEGTSDVAMQQRLGLLSSLPLISDEITAKNRKDFEWIAGFIFSMSEGQGKERMESGANKERENTTYWNSIALFSSNTIVTDFLDVRKHSSQGEMMRVLEWLPSKKIVWADNEHKIVQSLKDNYGCAGHAYAQWLVNNEDTAKQVLATITENLRAEFEFSNDERFWLAGCAALVAGGVLAGKEYAGIVDYPLKGIKTVLRTMVNEARVAVRGNVKNSEDILNTFIAQHYGQFVVVKALDGALAASLGDSGVIDQNLTRSQVWGRVEHGVTPGFVDFYIEEKLLKQECSANSFGYADFKKQMEAQHHVSYLKKDLMSKTKGPQMRVNAIKISRKVTEDEEAKAAIPVADT